MRLYVEIIFAWSPPPPQTTTKKRFEKALLFYFFHSFWCISNFFRFWLSEIKSEWEKAEMLV